MHRAKKIKPEGFNDQAQCIPLNNGQSKAFTTPSDLSVTTHYQAAKTVCHKEKLRGKEKFVDVTKKLKKKRCG